MHVFKKFLLLSGIPPFLQDFESMHDLHFQPSKTKGVSAACEPLRAQCARLG